jgi:hypothetical protein
MNRLRGMTGYLAGPMEFCPNTGKDWREDMSTFIRSLGAGALNPLDKPTDFVVEDRELESRQMYTLAEVKCEEIHQIMKPIVGIDLRMVDEASFVILYIDTDIHTCGSYNEQTHACLQRKPVIVVCKQGKYGVPSWLWGICNHQMFFSDFEEVKEYLEHVAYDKDVKHFNRWRFFDYNKVFGKEVHV